MYNYIMNVGTYVRVLRVKLIQYVWKKWNEKFETWDHRWWIRDKSPLHFYEAQQYGMEQPQNLQKIAKQILESLV